MVGKIYGGIETGGTKVVCAIGTMPDDIIKIQFPTAGPAETIGKIIHFFKNYNRFDCLAAIGVVSFGPLDLDRNSSTYGSITTTPKEGWSNVDILHWIQNGLDLPVALETDVNGAALGEWVWGAAKGLDTFIYLTVGTGIGGGGIINGDLMHGLLHPEMGHIRIPHDRERDPFAGCCPFHGDCLEGLACGPAIEQRWGARGETLPPDHPAWPLEAHYLALALANFICTLSPQRIILGGGVMNQRHLFPMIRREVHGVRRRLSGEQHRIHMPQGCNQFRARLSGQERIRRLGDVNNQR